MHFQVDSSLAIEDLVGPCRSKFPWCAPETISQDRFRWFHIFHANMPPMKWVSGRNGTDLYERLPLYSKTQHNNCCGCAQRSRKVDEPLFQRER